MTSQFEGSPNALMEAMALGVPCISSNCPCGGPKMLINNGNNGFLYEIGNIDEFLDRLNVLAENSELRIKFSKSAKNRAKDFTEEKVFNLWHKYQEICMIGFSIKPSQNIHHEFFGAIFL